MTNSPFDRLEETMTKLRSETGCPWDKEQTLRTLIPYLIEESYEVIEAIYSGDPQEHLEELGDLLFQIVFQSQIRKEEGHFTFSDVASTIDEKMRRRHPHVFSGAQLESAEAVMRQWDKIKQAEKEQDKDRSRFAGVPKTLPALLRAQRLGEKASKFNLDWSNTEDISATISEEIKEFEHALSLNSKGRMTDEFGDILFSLVNLARHLNIDPEAALQEANNKFEQRARLVEETLSNVAHPTEVEVETAWQDAKIKTGSLIS